MRCPASPVCLLCLLCAPPVAAAEPWSAKQDETLESRLDAFFAASDGAKQKQLYDETLVDAGVGLSFAELRTIAKAKPPVGKEKRGVTLVSMPWIKGDPRGAFNLALPDGYTPRKAWGVVVALHGSGGDVDNMVHFHSPALNRAGFITIFPQTTDRKQTWGTLEQQGNVMRILDWVARRYRVDFRRIVVTGASMGGMGTWSFATALPDVWSAAAPVAGAPPVQIKPQLESLRGMPLYILHGDRDERVSVELPRRIVALLQEMKIEHTYVEAKGEGHTPSGRSWAALNKWIVDQPRKPASPRPLLLPADGSRPLWKYIADPLGIHDADDPIMQAIHAGEQREALKQIAIAMRDPKQRGRRYELFAKRAVARLPVLLQPFDNTLKPASFLDSDTGWNYAGEKAALRDLKTAVLQRTGKGPSPASVDAELYILMARIQAKQFTLAVRDTSSVRWMLIYNECAKSIEGAQQASPLHPGLNPLIAGINKRLPKERTRVIRYPN